MAETDPVQIVVEIVDEFSDELRDLRRKLERLDAKEIDVDFKLDEGGQIESVKAQLETIRDMMDTTLFINVQGAARAEAIKQALERDMRSTLHVDRDGGGGGGGLRGIVDELTNDTINDIVREHDLRWSNPARAFRDFDNFDAPRGFGADMPEVDMRFMDRDAGRRWRHLFGVPVGESIDTAAESFDGFGKKLLRYKPSIMDWWNLLALFIPIVITLAGALVGLAAALGAVATAGVAIVGLGLLGWGQTMQETVQNLTADIKTLAQELFGVFRPVGVEFEPIVSEWMGALPHALGRLTEPLQRMTVFADGLGAMGSGFIDWLVNVINAMADMSHMATQVSSRLGGAIGQFLIDALTAMLAEVYRNQDAYIELAELLVDVIVIIFNASKVIAFVIAQFEWFFRIIAGITDFLSNKWSVAFLSAIVAMFAMYRLILLAGQAWIWFGNAGILGAVSAITGSLIPALSAGMVMLTDFIGLTGAATFSWMRLAGVTGLGLLIAGAGLLAADAAWKSMSGPSTGMGGGMGGTNTYIQIQGDVRKREMDRLLDEVGGETRNEMSIQNSMSGGT